MKKSDGILSLKKAAKLLNKHAPEGESLAYINPEEAKLLRSHGGSGIMTLANVPSYWDWDTVKNIGKKALEYVPKVIDFFSSPAEAADDPNDPYSTNIASRHPPNDPYSTNIASRHPPVTLDVPKKQVWKDIATGARKWAVDRYSDPSNILRDVTAVGTTIWGIADDYRKGKISKEKYEEEIAAEAANRAEVQANLGSFSVGDIPEETEIARFTEATGRPDMETNPWAAEGGRIGAFNGGIQGLMPQRIGYNGGGLTQYEIFKLKELGYPKADSDPGSYGGVKVLKDILKLHNYAQGGRIGASNGGIQSLNQQLNSLPEYYMPYPAAQGGRIGYGLGEFVTGTGVAAPGKGGTGSTQKLIDYFTNRVGGLGGGNQAVPGSGSVRHADSFMGNLLTNAPELAHLSSSADSEFQLQAEYEQYIAEGGDLEYEEWKQTRMVAAQGGRIGYAYGTNYGSFKDYLESNIGHLDESVQDAIWDAYSSGDEGKLFKLLKIHIGFEDRAQGGRIGAFNGGIQGLMPRPGFAFGTEVVEDTTVTEDIFSNIPPEMKMTDLDNLPEFFLIELEKLIEDYFEDIGERPRTINDIEKWYRGKNKSTMNLRENIQAPGIGDLQETVTEETLAAQGGRIGYQGNGAQDVDPMAEIVALMSKRMTEGLTQDETDRLDKLIQATGFMEQKAQGGRIGAQEGGVMPLLNLGGMEKDYREDGGFVPLGRQEKADDVPARLSKNEFVFTADAVKAAGGGDIDEGAQRMYNVMKNLEAGGEISQESQGQA